MHYHDDDSNNNDVLNILTNCGVGGQSIFIVINIHFLQREQLYLN